MIELIKPLGHITTIVAFNEDQDLNALKLKQAHLTYEFYVCASNSSNA